MMLTTSLPLLPPPATSLLPPLSQSVHENPTNTPNAAHSQHPSRRLKSHASSAMRNTTLAALGSDERSIAQRKMAIAMYGYSWLKPAGCAKTMLGRREEEVEREEVERQLREVDLQERAQLEAEEQDRLALLAETGDAAGDRDLDADIPDADSEGDGGDGEEGSEEYDEHDDVDMDGDLDEDIPTAEAEDDDEIASPDPDGIDANWVYDTRREPDSDDDEFASSPDRPRPRRTANATVAGVRIPVPGGQDEDNEREAEEVAEAMLGEDEIFELSGDSDRDLDDDVPDAASEQDWEHTDTELEESEMDMSLLPTHGHSSVGRVSLGDDVRRPTPGRGGPSMSRRVLGSAIGRRSSGPWIADPSPNAQRLDIAAQTPTTGLTASTGAPPQTSAQADLAPASRSRRADPQLRSPYAPVASMRDMPPHANVENLENGRANDSAGDFLVSDDAQGLAAAHRHRDHGAATVTSGQQQQLDPASASGANSRTDTASRAAAARTWLDEAAAVVGGSARRTLFGRSTRRGMGVTATAAADHAPAGSFTPSPAPAVGVVATAATEDWRTPDSDQHQIQQSSDRQGHARRRSGRFLGGRRRGD